MNSYDITEWTPPDSPDPSVILREAAEDAHDGRHALALVKYSWYWHHALEHEPAHYAVRLSYALIDWHELATKYPPALKELCKLCDCATQNALEGIDVYESFREAKSINFVLGANAATCDLFMRLHQANNGSAKTVYRFAQPALIKAGKFDICNQYLEPATAINRIIEVFRKNRNRSLTDFAADAHRREFAAKTFKNESATIIALLVVADRRDEAEMIAQRVINEWTDESVQEIVNRALCGEFPPQRDYRCITNG